MDAQEIIVYHSPAQKAFWDMVMENPNATLIVCGVLVVLAFVFLWWCRK